MSAKEANLTQGSILRVLTKLSMPIVIAAFFSTAYSITDMAWIGKLGGSQYESFYLIVQNQRAVSGAIAVEITKRDAENIIASGGDARLIDSAARNLGNGYLLVK